jgi:Na+-transporting methylmalonyl-CoA/oxaloacetate decarboxylase gamma subunit
MSGVTTIYSSLWVIYRMLGRISQSITVTLEGEGGIMWTLLFLVLFISLMTQGIP